MPTYVLISVNIAFYIFTSLLSGNFIEMDAEVLARYGQTNVLVFHGWYWQLLTSMFVHVNIVHIVGNLFFLLIFGLRAEEAFSIEEYMLVYLLSGLAGNLLTLLFMDPLTISAGASGAIFGMFGAVTIYVNRAMRRPIGSALIYAFFLLILSIGLNVNIYAHAGGLVVGLLLGYGFALMRKRPTAYEFRYSYTT
jgi:rhomboid protease GluP